MEKIAGVVNFHFLIDVVFDFCVYQAQSDACLRRFLRAFEDVDEAHSALVRNINWREEYGVHCLSRGDDDIEEQLALGKAEVLDFPDHVGRLVTRGY